MCMFAARTTKRLKIYLPLCVCRDVLFTFGVWVFVFMGIGYLICWLGGFVCLFVHFGFLLFEWFFVGVFFGTFIFCLVWFSFGHAIST